MIDRKKWIFIALLAGIVAIGGAYAGGNREVPEATLTTSGTQYISPNGDGVQDAATIEFKVTVYVKSNEGYVPEYGITLSDSSGNVIRQVIQKEKSDLNWFLQIFRSYQAFTLEKTIAWDGLDEEGNPVADGVYSTAMWIVAASNQRTDIELDDFVVDTKAPSVTVVDPDPKIFSPNGDGNLDDLTIAHKSGTSEDLWEAKIADSSGKTVRTYNWRDTGPDNIIWDGTTDGGEASADGRYTYSLTATDRGGNSFQYSIDNIELNTVKTPVAVAVDDEFISPNGDGVQDTVTISLSQDEEFDIVSWKVAVYDDEGSEVRSYGEAADPPEEVTFDGMDESGSPVAQGIYKAVYSLKYRNGNNPGASASFVVDVTKPDILVTVLNPIFSPNGDGRQDQLEVSFKSSEIVTWRGSLTAASGGTIVSTGSDQTTSLIVWRGEKPDGTPAAEGEYFAQATFTDRAGNRYTIPKERAVIDLTPPKVSFSMDKDYFSPDNDGIKDTLTARFTSNEAVKGLLTIVDSAGRDVGTLGGFGRAVQPVSGSYEYEWNGIAGSGLYIPDGTYSVQSVYEDPAGNRTSLRDASFTVDTRKAWVSLTAPKGFSPNGDGEQDTLRIDVQAGFYDTVESWSASYIDASGSVMYVQKGDTALPKSLEWDGAMQYASDVTAPEGRYHVALDVVYRKGDAPSAESGHFFVDVTPPAVNLQAAADPFAKAGDSSMEGDLYITMQIEDAHDVTDWGLDVLSPDKEIVRSFAGTGDLEDQVMWKSEKERVSPIPISEMVILRVVVMDEVGNRAVFEQTVPLDLLVVRRDGKLYLLVPNVIFGAYEYSLDSRGDEMYARNLASIKRVKQIFDKYTNFDLQLEGHALNIYGEDPERYAEEEEVLMPLTQRRATTVLEALVDEGMARRRIKTSWYGGTQPIIDPDDRENRWKNRRVEFIMLESD